MVKSPRDRTNTMIAAITTEAEETSVETRMTGRTVVIMIARTASKVDVVAEVGAMAVVMAVAEADVMDVTIGIVGMTEIGMHTKDTWYHFHY